MAGRHHTWLRQDPVRGFTYISTPCGGRLSGDQADVCARDREQGRCLTGIKRADSASVEFRSRNNRVRTKLRHFRVECSWLLNCDQCVSAQVPYNLLVGGRATTSHQYEAVAQLSDPLAWLTGTQHASARSHGAEAGVCSRLSGVWKRLSSLGIFSLHAKSLRRECHMDAVNPMTRSGTADRIRRLTHRRAFMA